MQTENEIKASHKKNAISSLKVAKFIQFLSTFDVHVWTSLF